MLIDLLNSANYIMVNKDAIRIFGLNTAVYCSELLNIYKKACLKKKLFDNSYFKVDREYITKQTTLSLDDQIKCDLNLSKVNIINRSEQDPDLIHFDVETFASLLSCEDIKVLDKVSAKVKTNNPKGLRQTKREVLIQRLKEGIPCKTYELLMALRDWVDAIMSNPNKYLSSQQVVLFKDKIDDYCDGDLQKALKIVEIATIHQYVDCQWAINVYEKDLDRSKTVKVNAVRNTLQKRTNVSELGSEEF